jgi:hypothetical protein
MAKSDADAAFEAMVAANPNATILDGPHCTSSSAPITHSEADAAFARMAAAHPNAQVYPYPLSDAAQGNRDDVEAAYERMVADNPGATVIRGPAGGGQIASSTGACSASTWHFSPTLSQERKQELMAFVGANAGAPPTPADEKAGDVAFKQMLEGHPNAQEIMPGVFAEPLTADELSRIVEPNFSVKSDWKMNGPSSNLDLF